MEIDGSPVDDGGVYFIAEAGVNHDGDTEQGRRLIDAASEAGADAVKFQTFSADRLVARSAPKADYQETDETESQHEMLRRYELGREAHETLAAHARDRGITFLSTPFDRQSADLLVELGVPAIKIGSGELTNRPLLEHVAGLGRPLIVSTGMGTLAETRTARGWIRDVAPDLDLALLHCTSSYPAPTGEVNLRAMRTMAEAFPEPVGFSDHTLAAETPAFAVAAGATVVEKHFTLDRTLPGPDHEMSLEPDELTRAVELARTAATARGSADKQPTASEAEMRHVARKSLHAAAPIEPGERLTEQNVKVVRPAAGLSPAHYFDVLGTTVTEALASDDPITPTHLDER